MIYYIYYLFYFFYKVIYFKHIIAGGRGTHNSPGPQLESFWWKQRCRAKGVLYRLL